MSRPAVSSPLDLGSLLLSLSLPVTPRRSPDLIVMDRLSVRLLETHQEVSLSRDSPHASSEVFVFPDRVTADASPVEIRILQEGRSGGSSVPVINIDKSEMEEEEDPILRAVFAPSISVGAAPASVMEHDADEVPPRRPLTIADMDVREIEYDRSDHFLSPSDAPSEPTTPNANRSRRPSEKMDYGIDWIEAFKMAPPRHRHSTLADEIDGRLSAMDQEEQERELMAETLHKIDEVAKGKKPSEKRSELLFDSSITLKDIFGQSAKSDDVVFNASISLDDVFAGIKTASAQAQKKKSTADKYYYHDDDEEEEVLPPEVAALYSSRPSTIPSSSSLPHSSSVNIDDVFAALDRRDRKAAPRPNLDDYYADPPSEVFSDSAVSSRQLTERSKATDRERGEEEEEEEGEEGVGGSETRSSSSGVSHGKVTLPREEHWLTSLIEKRRSVEMSLPRGRDESESPDEPSPPLDPSQLRLEQTEKQTRKESYLHVGELFAAPSTAPRVERIEKEKADLDWINRLADRSTEEILDAVFACTAEGGGEGRKKCHCQACDPTRSIYLEREAAAASEERKRSLHLVNPVEITLEEVFEGKKNPKETPIMYQTGSRGERGEEQTVSALPPVDIDLEVVFSTPVHSPSSRGIDSDKWQPRTLVKEIKQSVVPQSRKRSAGHEPPLAPSDIDLGEVFAGPHRSPSTPFSTPTTEVDVDLIFAPSSSTTTTSRVNLDKFHPRTLERNYKEPMPVTASYPVIVADPVDMEAVFSPSKMTTEESEVVSKSTKETRRVPELLITNSSVPVIIAEEIVSEAIEEALRSPKLEKAEEQGMISSSTFPIFVVDNKEETLAPKTENVKFGLNSRSASPEPSSVDLEQVFSGVSSEFKPRIDLSKYENRTLERRKEPAQKPVIITNSSFPVIIADPLDMEQVFNPSTTHTREDHPSILITKTLAPKTENVKFGLNSRSASPEPSSVDLDQVFSGVSMEYKPRIDLSKYENRTLERRKEPAQTPVMITNSSFPVIIADPLDMDQVFNPSTSRAREDQPSILITNSSVPVIIAEEIVAGAMDEALRSPKLEKTDEHGMISNSSFPVFLVDKKEETLAPTTENVKFGLTSRSASPEPSSVDLDQVFSGGSSESKPRIDLSKYENRTLERRKEPVQKPVIITNSSYPVVLADPLDMEQVFNPSTSHAIEEQRSTFITNSSVPVIIAEEIVSEAIEEALRSPKLEKTEDHGMISNSSFPVFLVEKKPETLHAEEVTFALNTRSASPEPTSVDLDQVFSGVSSETKPRIDLSKYENRTLERRKEPSPVVISHSPKPTIIADPLDMDLVFNPSPTPVKKEELSTSVAVAEVREAVYDLPRPQTFEQDIDLDQAFTASSSTSPPRVDLSKFEARSLERRRDTPRPVVAAPPIHSTVVADPLDMDLVFAPKKRDTIEEEEEGATSPRSSPIPSCFDQVDAVSDAIAEVIVADAIDEAMRSPAMKNASSTFSFVFQSEEKTGSFAAIDSASSLDSMAEHPVYPRTITHVRSSAPDFVARGEEVADEVPLKAVEEEDEDDQDEETPLPVFARSRNPAYGMASDRPFVSQSEDAPAHFADPISVVTDLTPTPSVKKIISPEPSKERIPEAKIDLEEVFAAPMSPSTSSTSRVDLEKFVVRTLERRKEPVRIATPVTEERETRQSDLPPSSISVDDIFSPQPPSPVAVAAPEKPSRQPQQSESAVTDPMDDPAAEVDLDSVFDASFGSDRLGPVSRDRILTAEFNARKDAAQSTMSTLPSSELGDELSPAPVPPPRRSPRPSEPVEETPAPAPRQKLISWSSYPILVDASPSGEDREDPVPPPRNRGVSPMPAGVNIIESATEPTTPPNSLSTTPVPPARTHRRTDSISLPRSRHASYSNKSESIAESDEPVLTVDATFSSSSSSDLARPSVTVREDGAEATVDILLPPPRAPPRMNFPPPPPVEEIEYERTEEDELEMSTSTIEEDVKEARLMASPDFPPLSVVTAPVEIDMDAVFESKILTPSRFDTDRWQPRTLEREKKRTVEEVVERREKSDLPESTVDIDEVFSGRLTTTDVEYVTSPTRFSLKKSEEKKERWEDELSKEIDEYEQRRNRLGQETDGSVRSTISRSSTIPFSSTPEGTWRRNESLRSAQEPVVALIEKEKRRIVRGSSSASEKSGKSATKRKGSKGSYKVEHILEPQSDGLVEMRSLPESGAQAEAREAKRNGKVWRVDRVQKTASASIEDSEEEKGVRIQVHSIPAPLSISMDSIDDIERSIDDAFDEALSPRGRVIEIHRIPSSSIVRAEVHRHDEHESETYPHPEYTTETLEGRGGYRSVTSLPSTSDTTKIVFPLTSPLEQQRYVTSASIRLEKSLPTPETRNRYRHAPYDADIRWVPSDDIIEKVTMRKRSRSEGPLGLLEDMEIDGHDSADVRNYRMSWHPSSVRADLEDRGYRGIDEKIHGSYNTTVRVAGYSSPKSGRSREARERRKKIIRKSRTSLSSSTSTGGSNSSRPDEEEMLEVEVKKRHIVLRGSYNLVVAKDEPLGILLLSLSDGQPIVPAALDFSVLPKLRRLLRECMTRRARSVSMLSSRGASLLDITCPANENFKTVGSDLFHPIDNPRGKVNLCTAENRTCEAEVSKKLEEIRFHPETHRWIQRYAGSGGIKETRLALVSHFSSLYSISIDEEETVLLPSCTAAYDVFSHLCCDPHDVILTPAPYYARIRNDCQERNECRVEPVALEMTKPELFVSDFEREFATWASKGERVRAIVLVNPHNPLGNIFTRHQIMSVCEWAISNDVFIIVDEILAGTIYSDKNLAEFPSILGLKKELSKPEYLVWMGSLSKDLGLPGIKTALVVSSSPAIREAVRRMENLGTVPAPSQMIVNQLLADKAWLSSTLSSARHRLHSHSRFVVQSLEDISVPCVIPKAGICLMADFSKFMSSLSSEEENALHRRLIEHGVVLTKGESTVAPEPGWFRISFGVPKEELELGMRRIYSTIARDATLKRSISYGEESNGVKREWLVSEVRPTSPGTTVESA